MNKKKMKKNILPYAILLTVILLTSYFFGLASMKVNDISFDKFIEEAEQGNVEEINITPKVRASVYEISGTLKGYEEGETFFMRVPLAEEVMSQILTLDEENKIKIETQKDPESSTLLLFVMNVLPFLIIGLFLFLFITKQMGNASKSMDFGKNKAKLNENKNSLTFSDVAGLDEEKEEVKELIDFLQSPKKFQKLGARIPKGVLLFGPPGTGKTLLARAVAGEAKVPFYYISGSDFVELFVGVGASRVRDLFKEAKSHAPCLIFIDEIDAVGRQRGAGLGGGHDEREQTLNQLLTEMDGFSTNEGIIVMAATNRPDVLDPALLRPGRFDRQVTVSLPDVKGREAILKVHTKSKKFEPNVKLENIAKRTVGFSGAELENLLNEAALLSARRNKTAIGMSELDEAHDRVLMGPAKKSRKYNEHEKKVVAYHEAGHAVIGLTLRDANEVQKITIIPRGSAGGYNLMIPKEDTYFSTKTQLLQTITGLLAGRVAEEVMFEEVTTGAHNDFERASKIARSMVTEYGMSNLGPVQFEHQDSSSVFLGRDYNKSRNFSSQVAFEIDQEQRRIINECYEETKTIINSNLTLLKIIASELLEKETLSKEEIDEIYNSYNNGEEVVPKTKEVELSKNNNKSLELEKKSKTKKNIELDKLTVNELKNIIKELEIELPSKATKKELIDLIKNN